MTDHHEHQPPKVEPGRGADADLTGAHRRVSARGNPLAGTVHAGETGVVHEGAGTWKIEQGADVLCRDGEKIGEVVEIRPGYLVVEEGFFDPQDLYVPVSLITRHDETCLTLSISCEDFEEADWTREPGAEGQAGDAES